MNVFLIGYRGSGKSTTGAILARRLGWTFVDLDELIEKQAGKSIVELFRDEGEDAFRQRERAALESIRRQKQQVIALGGGAIISPEVRTMVKRMGKAVWLQAPAAILHSRLQKDAKAGKVRPELLPGGGLQEVETKLNERAPLYRAVANHIVDSVSTPPEDIAESIELWLDANDADAAADEPPTKL